jgi:hypothetical protein
MSKVEAQLLAHQHGPPDLVDLHFEGMSGLFGRGNPQLSITERGEGCACSMLTDDADWNEPAWEIQRRLLLALAETLTVINERAHSGFAFEALWVGDKPEDQLEMAFEGFIELVRQNKLATKTRYIIVPNEKSGGGIIG